MSCVCVCLCEGTLYSLYNSGDYRMHVRANEYVHKIHNIIGRSRRHMLCVCVAAHTLTQTAFTITIHSAIVIVVGNKHSYVITPRQRRHLNRCTRAESTWFMTNGTIIIHTKRSPRVRVCVSVCQQEGIVCGGVMCGDGRDD